MFDVVVSNKLIKGNKTDTHFVATLLLYAICVCHYYHYFVYKAIIIINTLSFIQCFPCEILTRSTISLKRQKLTFAIYYYQLCNVNLLNAK